jgi:hypothetical protein
VNQRCEPPTLVVPPAAPPIEPLLAAKVVPHPDEVGVAGFDAAADELAAAGDVGVEHLDQFAASAGIEAVGVSDETEAGGPVGGEPTQLGGVVVVFDGDALPATWARS